MAGWRWYVPWMENIRLSTAYDGKPRWVSRWVWSYVIVQRWSRRRSWAFLSGLKGVIFYRLLLPVNKRWTKQERYIPPRWYCWLVD